MTGAASGIGRALAEKSAQEGMKVVLADIEESALKQAEGELKASGAEVLAVRTDVSQAADVETLARQAFDTYGAVHLLFNNASVSAGTTVWESTLADWQWVLGVNLWGAIHGIHYFVPRMLAQDSEGHIVNTASAAGLVSGSGLGIYKVSKHGIVTLSETLALELAARGARLKASVLCPGFVNTRIIDAERNRPQALQNAPEERHLSPEMAAMLQAMRQLLQAGLAPSQVADLVFDAIRQEKFYILTDPQNTKQLGQLRMEDILQERIPTDSNLLAPQAAWKYALSLDLCDPGFDHTVLSEFRSRLVEGHAEQRLLDLLLEQCRQGGWLKAGGRQRTDSTHVLGKVRALNRTLCVAQTMVYVLNVLSKVAPEWVRAHVPVEWVERYGERLEHERLPKEEQERKQYVTIANLIQSQSGHRVDLVGPTLKTHWYQAETGYDLTHFSIDWDAQTVTCPQGRTSSSWTPVQDAGKSLIKVKFSQSDCKACPARASCTGTTRRTLTLHPREQMHALFAARKREETKEFKDTYRRRAGIEGTHSQGVRAMGLRRSRYIGLPKTHLGHVAIATAVNVIQLMSWLRGEAPEQTRTSVFKRVIERAG